VTRTPPAPACPAAPPLTSVASLLLQDIPKSAFWGVSSATGDLVDNHDIIHFTTRSLNGVDNAENDYGRFERQQKKREQAPPPPPPAPPPHERHPPSQQPQNLPPPPQL